MIDEQADAALGIAEIGEDGGVDALTPESAPEAFDLAQSLRPPWRRHYLLDAALLQLAREHALATPSHVLRAVVGEDLLRRAVGCQRRP